MSIGMIATGLRSLVPVAGMPFVTTSLLKTSNEFQSDIRWQLQ